MVAASAQAANDGISILSFSSRASLGRLQQSGLKVVPSWYDMLLEDLLAAT